MRITVLTYRCVPQTNRYPKSGRARSHWELISVQDCPESVPCDMQSCYPDGRVNPVTTPVAQAMMEKKLRFRGGKRILSKLVSKQWLLYHLCTVQLLTDLLLALQTIKITAEIWVFMLLELLRALTVEGSQPQLMVCIAVSGSARTVQASLMLEYLCWTGLSAWK